MEKLSEKKLNEKKCAEFFKEKKYGYGNKVKEKLILLLWIDFGPLLNISYAQKIFTELKKSEFRGVYLVHLPASSKDSSHPHNGQVIIIKEFC